MRFTSLSIKLVIAMLVPLSLLLLAATWFETRSASQAMIQTGERAASDLATTVKEELQGVLRSTKSVTHALAIPMERLDALDEPGAIALLRESLERFELLYGSTLAYEIGPDQAPMAPYLYRENDEILVGSLAADDYRYWEWPWFREPLATGEAGWSRPYYDEGGGGARMVTYSVPLTLNGRRAVLTADLELGFLTEIAESSLLGRPGIVMVFDADGRIVAHPRGEWLLTRDLDDLSREMSLPALAELPRLIALNEQGWLRPDDGMNAGVEGLGSTAPGRLMYLPLKEAGWGIGVYFSDHDFLAEIEEATRFRLLFTLALLILLASVLAWVSLRSLRPLGELADRTRAIAQGEFRGDTPGLKRKDEIGRLSRAFHLMQEHLQHYIEDLTQATAARERMQAELTTARLLQRALLPDHEPDEKELGVELTALLQPARAVGGDLYNYTKQSANTLFFAIGDVSDKGVPAALFMSRANAMIKSAAVEGRTPCDVLNVTNLALCEDNELCMFLTLLGGALNLDTGELEYASAGHDAPLRIKTNGEVDFLELETGPPVGINEEAEFQTFRTRLEPGEALVTFTDGVTEARNAQGELFGDDRLVEALRDATDLKPASLIRRITESVESFAGEAEQADDLTLLVIRFAGKHSTQ